MNIVSQRAGFGDRATPNPQSEITLMAGDMNVDVFTRAGSPSRQIDLVVTIPNGIVIGSRSAAEFALVVSDEFTADSTVKLVFIGSGTVGGHGGMGGNGDVVQGDAKGGEWLFGPGGGGGAGCNPGQGGVGAPDGDSGTKSVGGAGKSCGAGSTLVAGSAGGQGGGAIKIERPVTLDASAGDGSIWGGGGGGGGGFDSGSSCTPSGDGGDPGQAGGAGSLGGGSPGVAIDGVSFVTKVGAFDVRGPEIN